jgi:hypothetical protein
MAAHCYKDTVIIEIKIYIQNELIYWNKSSQNEMPLKPETTRGFQVWRGWNRRRKYLIEKPFSRTYAYSVRVKYIKDVSNIYVKSKI